MLCGCAGFCIFFRVRARTCRASPSDLQDPCHRLIGRIVLLPYVALSREALPTRYLLALLSILCRDNCLLLTTDFYVDDE